MYSMFSNPGLCCGLSHASESTGVALFLLVGGSWDVGRVFPDCELRVGLSLVGGELSKEDELP